MSAGADFGTGVPGRLPSEGFTQLGGRRLSLATACTMSAFSLAILGQSTLATAMPSIVDDLGEFDRYTWVATAYLVASVVAIPIAGRLSDLYGRHTLFTAGIALFIIGSLPAALSQSVIQLTGFTAIQGAGAGSVLAVSFVAIGDLFPPEERGKYLGLLGAVFGAASFVGFVLGGLISDHLTWRGIFVLNVLSGLPVLALALYFPRIKPEAEICKLDYPGMATLVLAVVPIMLALSLASTQYGWRSWQISGSLAFGLTMIALFVVIESRSVSPIMPLEIYRNRAVVVSMVVSFFVGFGMYAIIVFLPLFFQAVRGASATVSGGLLAPMVLGLVCGTVISGRMLSKANARYRLHALAGTATLTAGTLLLSIMNASTSYGEAAAYVLVAGFGVGSTLTSVTVVVQNSVLYKFLGTATSALQFFRTVSGTLGIAVLGVLLRARFSSNLDENISGDVRDALLPGQLEAIRSNPQAYIDASATPEFAGGNAAELADTLLGSVNAALASSMSYVFLISAALLTLSVVASLFLLERRDAAA